MMIVETVSIVLSFYALVKKGLKLHAHQALSAVAALALPLALMLGTGLRSILRRQHRRHPV